MNWQQVQLDVNEDLWYKVGVGYVLRHLWDEVCDVMLDSAMEHLNPWFMRPRNGDKYLTDAR